MKTDQTLTVAEKVEVNEHFNDSFKFEQFPDMDGYKRHRLGKITASALHTLMKHPRNTGEIFTETGLTYLKDKVAEVLTGISKPEVNAIPLKWGKEHEAEAVQVLKDTGLEFVHCGASNPIFIPFNKTSGCSPDGLMRTHVVEIKCPYTSCVHVESLLASIPDGNKNDWLKNEHFDYYTQVQFCMLCTNKVKAYFVSYDPRMIKDVHKLAIMEILADPDYFNEMRIRIGLATEYIRERLKLLTH